MQLVVFLLQDSEDFVLAERVLIGEELLFEQRVGADDRADPFAEGD